MSFIMSFGGGVFDMTFYFLCPKLESVGMSEIVLESFRDSYSIKTFCMTQRILNYTCKLFRGISLPYFPLDRSKHNVNIHSTL